MDLAKQQYTTEGDLVSNKKDQLNESLVFSTADTEESEQIEEAKETRRKTIIAFIHTRRKK